MFYRLLPDGAGEIVSERRLEEMEPYLGLRYPAWDIPAQARALYASTPIRSIANVAKPDLPMRYAKGFGAADFDLSNAVLRGTSPIHCEYLANMGVASSMTIPVVVEGKLWGLITCHGESPRIPSIDMLDTAEVIGHIVSFSIAKQLSVITAGYDQAVSEIKHGFASFQSRTWPLAKFVEVLETESRRALNFDGIGVQVGSDWHTRGFVPARFNVNPDGAFAIPSQFGDLRGSNNALSAIGRVSAVDLAGYLEIPLDKDPVIKIVFFRKAVRSQVSWAGSPKKDIQEIENTARLSPRKSFARYIEEKGDRCEEWISDEIQFALSLQRECAASSNDAGGFLRRQDSLRVLANEMNHRVKNILALVKSLSSHARESTSSSESYAESLEQRVFSLAASHDMLTRSEMEGLPLRNLARMELAPYLSEEQIEAAITGPEVLLSADAVLMATLLFHELTSNAVKHGALSVSEGRVDIEWRVAEGEFTLRWREKGGPDALLPERQGFGMELLREAIPFEFNGMAKLNFVKSGFEAEYTMPAYPFLKVGTSDPLSTDEVVQQESLPSQIGSAAGASLLKTAICWRQNTRRF